MNKNCRIRLEGYSLIASKPIYLFCFDKVICYIGVTASVAEKIFVKLQDS